MTVSKLRNSTAIDQALAIKAINTALKADEDGIHQALSQADTAGPNVAPKSELTAKGVSRYLQGMSATSCTEIDALINDLQGLREKLMADGNRIEQDVVEFAALNQSVIRLTEVVADSVTHVKAPSIAE